jgi:hypothetical protein
MTENKKIKIEDNFLKQEDFDKLQKFMWGECVWGEPKIPWFYGDIIDYPDDEDKFMFFHLFYHRDVPQSPCFAELNPLFEMIKPLSTFMIKANLLTRTPNIVENKFHVDMGDLVTTPEKLNQWTTAIFYINTNNGYTKFEDGTKVESVANRLLTFPANMKHTGTSCTDEKTRVVINCNFYI